MTKVKRLLSLLALLGVLFTSVFSLSACGAKEVHVAVKFDLYSYDSEVGDKIECPNTINIECGKRYALVFTLEADADISIDVNVNLKKYVDEDATQERLDKDQQENLGLGYTNVDGIYTAYVNYKKEKKSDIIKQSQHSYFIIGMDRLPDDSTVPIEVTVKSKDDKKNVVVNNSDKCIVSVKVNKGEIDFTKEDHVIERLGSVSRMTFDIIKPDKCFGGVKIAFYKDDGNGQKDGLYGNIELTMEEFDEGNGKVTVNFGEQFSAFVDDYDERLESGRSYDIIVMITAVGGDSYNNKVIEFPYVIGVNQ